MSERFKFVFRRKDKKVHDSDKESTGTTQELSQEGETSNLPDIEDDSRDKIKTTKADSKPGMIDLKKLAIIGSIGAGLAIVSSVLFKAIRKDDTTD